MNEDRLGVAEIKCREFLKKHPTHTYAMSQLADIASRLGHYDDAEFLLEKATSFEPNDADLRMKYLMVLRKTQKFVQTTEQVEILCKKFPDNLLYQSQKAIEMMQNGDNANAIGVVDLQSLTHVLNIQVGECPYAVSIDTKRKVGVSTNQGTPSINTSATVFDLCKVYKKLGKQADECS